MLCSPGWPGAQHVVEDDFVCLPAPTSGSAVTPGYVVLGLDAHQANFLQLSNSPCGVASLWGGRTQKILFLWPKLAKGHEGTVPTVVGRDRDGSQASLHTAWHLGEWPIFRQRAVLVQPFPGCPLPELYRLLPRGTASCRQLSPAEDHWEGQLRQSQAGSAHPHRPGGEWACPRAFRVDSGAGPSWPSYLGTPPLAQNLKVVLLCFKTGLSV